MWLSFVHPGNPIPIQQSIYAFVKLMRLKHVIEINHALLNRGHEAVSLAIFTCLDLYILNSSFLIKMYFQKENKYLLGLMLCFQSRSIMG